MSGSVSRFFGGLLMTIGGLILFLSGACTLVFAVIASSSGGGAQVTVSYLMLGAIPIAIGLGLFLWGRAVYRSGARPPPIP